MRSKRDKKDRLCERLFGFPFIIFLLHARTRVKKKDEVGDFFGRWDTSYLFAALESLEKGSIIGKDVDGL